MWQLLEEAISYCLEYQLDQTTKSHPRHQRHSQVWHVACGFIKTIRKEQKEILRIWMKTETQQAQKRFKKSKRLYHFKQVRKTNKYDNNNKKKCDSHYHSRITVEGR